MSKLEKVKCSTPDFAVENAKKLLALFPWLVGGEFGFSEFHLGAECG